LCNESLMDDVRRFQASEGSALRWDIL
jgi:hypothetical protein